jgi:hypothetical protein
MTTQKVALKIQSMAMPMFDQSVLISSMHIVSCSWRTLKETTGSTTSYDIVISSKLDDEVLEFNERAIVMALVYEYCLTNFS